MSLMVNLTINIRHINLISAITRQFTFSMYEEPKLTKDERAKIVKSIKKKNISVSSQMVVQRISLSSRGVVNLISDSVNNQTVKDVGTLKALKVIRFSDTTNITSLENLPEEPNLNEIIASNTKLTSYKGLSKYNKVTTIKIDGTPMTYRKNYRIALLIAFGPRLQTINGINLTKEERQKAAKYPAVCKQLVDLDWDPTNEPPSRKELLQLMEQHHISDFSVKTALNKEKLNTQLSPKKSLSAAPQKKQEYVYNKYEKDEQLMMELAERLATVGIFIPQTDEMEINLLEAISELANIVTSVADTCEFREYSDTDYDVSDDEINPSHDEQYENDYKVSKSSIKSPISEKSEAELSQVEEKMKQETTPKMEQRSNTDFQEISEIKKLETEFSQDEQVKIVQQEEPILIEEKILEESENSVENLGDEEKVANIEIVSEEEKPKEEEDKEMSESIEAQVEKIEKVINTKKSFSSESDKEEEDDSEIEEDKGEEGDDEEEEDEEEEEEEKKAEPAPVENTEPKNGKEEGDDDDNEEGDDDDNEEEDEEEEEDETESEEATVQAQDPVLPKSINDGTSSENEEEEEEEEEEESEN